MCDTTSSVTSDIDNKIILGKSNTLREHTDYVMSICVKDNLIISGSIDQTIRIWDRDDTSSNTSTNKYNYECMQVLTGHTDWIRTICVKDNIIISGSDDETIRIWDTTNTNSNTSTNKYDYKCVQVLTGHTDNVTTICVKDNLIISGSIDRTIRIWDRNDTSTNNYDYKCVQILTGHNGCVISMCVKDNLIISGSSDETIRIWDKDKTSININTNTNTNTTKYNYKCMRVLKGHTGYVRSICVKDKIIITSSDETIRIWDRYDTSSSNTSTNKYDYKCVQILTGHTDYVMSICVKDNLIISCSYDKTNRIWDMTNTSTNKYDCKCVQPGHTSYIATICVIDNLIISGSSDGKIHVMPINLFPNESHIFKILINNYHLVSYLQKEILDYFRDC